MIKNSFGISSTLDTLWPLIAVERVPEAAATCTGRYTELVTDILIRESIS
jgi:hypothetical protein